MAQSKDAFGKEKSFEKPKPPKPVLQPKVPETPVPTYRPPSMGGSVYRPTISTSGGYPGRTAGKTAGKTAGRTTGGYIGRSGSSAGGSPTPGVVTPRPRIPVSGGQALGSIRLVGGHIHRPTTPLWPPVRPPRRSLVGAIGVAAGRKTDELPIPGSSRRDPSAWKGLAGMQGVREQSGPGGALDVNAEQRTEQMWARNQSRQEAQLENMTEADRQRLEQRAQRIAERGSDDGDPTDADYRAGLAAALRQTFETLSHKQAERSVSVNEEQRAEQKRERTAAEIYEEIQAQENGETERPAHRESEERVFEEHPLSERALADAKSKEQTETLQKLMRSRLWSGSDGFVGMANPPTSITDYNELYRLIARLPADFPVEGWEKRTCKEQLALMKKTDLSREEQWTFLNAPGVISTLGKIQDMQLNKTAYGLTTGEINSISDELMLLANARLEAKGADSPFRETKAKNHFLRMLEEREKEIMDAVLPNGKEKLTGNEGMGYDEVEDGADGEEPFFESFLFTPGQEMQYRDITETPAVIDMLMGEDPAPEQIETLQAAQAELNALYKNGSPTQQQIDEVIARACTELMNDTNRAELELEYARYNGTDSQWQPDVKALTDEIDGVLKRKTEEYSQYERWIQALSDSNKPQLARNASLMLLEIFTTDFMPGGRMDLKDQKRWGTVFGVPSNQAPGEREKFVYNGALMSPEMLGNWMYGYIAAQIGLSRDLLLIVGGADNQWQNLKNGERTTDEQWAHWGDHPNDYYATLDGYMKGTLG